MESSVATQDESMTLEATPEMIEQPARRRSSRTRSSVLARALASADLLMSIVACEVAALATGLTGREALAFAAVAGIGYPLCMFFLGVYSVDELRAWASGVPEAPKALVGALAFAWPLLGAADLLGAESPGLTATVATLATLIVGMAARGAV